MKEKRTKWIGIGAIIAVCLASILTVILLILDRDTTEVAYTYENVPEHLPEYDTDLFNIDGKLDEDIYKELCWWEEIYSEGDTQDAVKVRATAYLGENGVYFIFDVDDDNVNVDMKRASYNNSSITVYAAEEGTHKLEDNVWEIDILPTDYINAKRYLGGYYYGTVKANGYKNQPFVRSTTKGGDVNTPECKGYIMESYFPYGFLFGEGEKPENINLNFALQRSYSLEADARDVYYNFGQNVMSNWSWGDPGTWWTFHKMGLDSVDLTLETGKGGKLEHRNNYIARYQTEEIKIIPDKGYRISGLLLETKDETTDVMDQITWKDEVNTIKLRNVIDDVTLKASFEKIPTKKVSITGRITGKVDAKDICVRFICGGIAYEGQVSEDGKYSLDVPSGNGVLEVYSKDYGYVAKKIKVTADSQNITNNIKLTADDYGNKRVMSLPSEQVMGNKERVFDGEEMLGSISKTFAYDFTLKYNGKLLEKDGTPVADPTFGEYDNQYTSINFKGAFTDAKGKEIENSNMQLQIMSWNGDGLWMIKMWLDGQYVEARLGIDELKAFGSEEGVNFRLIFGNSKLSLCMVRDNNVYKVTELKTKATAERYLKYIDFYAEHCINHSIWYVEDQTLALGRTESNSRIVANVAHGDDVVPFKKSKDGKVVRTATNWDAHTFDGAFGWTGTLRVPGVLKNGKIQYHEMKTGYWVDTSQNDKDWYQFTVYIVGDGDSYYITKNNQKSKIELNAKQIKLLGTTGLQVGAFVNGNTVSYFVDNGKGEMVVFADLYDFNENQAWYPWPNKYGGAYLIHEGAPKIGEVISTGAEFYTGLSEKMDVKGFVKNVIGSKYQSNQMLNPVTHTFDSENNNYFVMNHKDVAENAFYGYNIKLDALKNTSVYINTKAWSDEYYANFVKMRVTEDCAYFIWQQGVSPYLCSEAIYFLNETQIAKLTNGGLDIFIEYKDNSTEMNLYVDDGKGNIVLASTYKDSLFRKSTGVTHVENLIGYSVEVANTETDVTVTATGCVVTEKGNFASDVKELYNKKIVMSEQEAKLIKIDSRELKSSDNKINLDYYDFNIGGNWFDRFNVKLPDAVDKDGKILADATVKMSARMQGDEYYGQNLYLHLEKDGIGYLEFVNYGGNWESYYYRLTDKQLAQLASKDGLNLFVSHKDGENNVTLYIADGTELISMKSFVYGKTELWAKGYSASCEGDKLNQVTVLEECYKYEGTFQNALKSAYGENYTFSDKVMPVLRSIHSVTSPTDKVDVDYGNLTVSGAWADHFNVKLDGAVDADGNILKYSTTALRARMQGNIYFQQYANLRLTESGAYLEMQNYGMEDGNWNTYVYQLNAEQLKQLISAEGMDIYIVHAADNKITVYISEGTKLVSVKEFTYGSKELQAKGYSATYTGAEDDSVQILAECFTYEQSLEQALKNLAGKDYTRSSATDIYSYNNVVKADKFSKTFTTNDKANLADYSKLWDDYFYRVNIQNTGINEDGTVVEDSTFKVTSKGYKGNTWKNNTPITFQIKKNGASTVLFELGREPWTKLKVELSQQQLQDMASKDGLNLFFVHSKDAKDTFVIYLEDGESLREMFTVQYPDTTNGGECVVSCTELVSDIIVKGDAYNYADTDLKTAIETVYGKNYEMPAKVDVDVEAVGAVVNGIKNIYHVGDKVSFTVQVNDGYKLETVTLNDTPLTADKDGKYQFTLTEEHVTTCNVKVNTSVLEKTLHSFISLTGKSSTADFGKNQFDGQNINKLMGTEGYSYLFHSTLKSTESPAAMITYVGWGQVQEKMYAQVQKDGDDWYLYLKYYNEWHQWKDVGKKVLSQAQLNKIAGNGLDIFLVNSGATKYSLYVENDTSSDVVLVAEFTSKVSNKQVYQISHNVAGVVTKGYFYKGYAPSEAMKKFISYTEFISLEGKSSTADFGKNQFDGKNINKLMGTEGYSYLFHSTLKSTGDSAALVTYVGWGQVQEKMYAQVQKDGNDWYLYLKYYNEWHQWKDVGKKALSKAQLDKIAGEGLHLFLVNSNASNYSLYVENDDGNNVILVAEFSSKVTNKQVYQVSHNVTGLATKGYFYKNYIASQDAAKNLFDILK